MDKKRMVGLGAAFESLQNLSKMDDVKTETVETHSAEAPVSEAVAQKPVESVVGDETAKVESVTAKEEKTVRGENNRKGHEEEKKPANRKYKNGFVTMTVVVPKEKEDQIRAVAWGKRTTVTDYIMSLIEKDIGKNRKEYQEYLDLYLR